MEKRELDYDLIAKCVRVSDYDMSKRKVVTKKIKGKLVKVIEDGNSKEAIDKFNQCVQNSDDTTNNSYVGEVEKLNKDKIPKISDVIPSSIANMSRNATFSVIGGLILGKVLKVGTWGTVGIMAASFLGLIYYDAKTVNKAIKGRVEKN